MSIETKSASEHGNNSHSLHAGVMPLVIINLNPKESECVACGRKLIDCRTGIPMYESEPVPHDWTGEWGGFDACQGCFDAYTAAQADENKLREWWEKVHYTKKRHNEKLIHG